MILIQWKIAIVKSHQYKRFLCMVKTILCFHKLNSFDIQFAWYFCGEIHVFALNSNDNSSEFNVSFLNNSNENHEFNIHSWIYAFLLEKFELSKPNFQWQQIHGKYLQFFLTSIVRWINAFISVPKFIQKKRFQL